MIIKSNSFAESLDWSRKLRFYLFRGFDLLCEKIGKRDFFNTTYHFFSKLKRNQVSFEDGGRYFRLEFNDVRYLVRKYTSDEQVFVDVIIDGEYDVAIDIAKRNLFSVSRIIDAGANCGITSIKFLTQFPDSVIIAIEPDSSNYESMVDSFRFSGLEGAIVPVNAALTTVDCRVSPGIGLDSRHWGKVFRVADELGIVDGISLKTILARQGWDTLDILKIDIEGAELDLFGNDDFIKELVKVKLIVMEIHDKGIRKSEIEESLINLGFFIFEHVHLTIAIQKRLISN